MSQLLSLTINNFMSFGENQIFDLKNQGLICLTGVNTDSASADSNGAGKSSVLEALYYVLYGKTIRGMKIDDVVRKNSVTGCFVRLSFTNKDGKLFEVQRNRGCKSDKNTLFIYQCLDSGEKIDLRGENKADTQKKLEILIGISANMFSQIILFGKGGMTRFSSLGDGEKKQLIEEMLDVAVYERAIKLVREKMNEFIKIKGRKQQELNLLLQHIATSEERVKDLEISKDEWCDRKQQEISKLEREISQLEIQSKTKKEDTILEPGLYEFQIRELEELVKEKNDQLGIVFSRKDELQKKFFDKQKELIKLHTEQTSTLSFLETEYRRIDELIFNGICPVCKQPTQEASFPGIDEYPGKIQRTKYAVAQSQKGITNLNVAREKLTSSIEQEEKQLREVIAATQSKTRAMTRELRSLQNTPNPAVVLQEVRQKLLEVNNSYQQGYPHQSKIDLANKTHQELLEKNQSLMEKIDQASLLISKYKVLIEVYTSIRSFVFETLLEEFNHKLLEYCQIFTQGQLFAVIRPTSETTRGVITEKVSINVYNNFGGENYDACSRGEKERIDFPIALALQDIAAKRGLGVGVCFFDELFEGIDEAGSRNMIELLKVAAQRIYTTTIIVITHNDTLKSYFPKHWSVVKQNSVTTLSCIQD